MSTSKTKRIVQTKSSSRQVSKKAGVSKEKSVKKSAAARKVLSAKKPAARKVALKSTKVTAKKISVKKAVAKKPIAKKAAAKKVVPKKAAKKKLTITEIFNAVHDQLLQRQQTIRHLEHSSHNFNQRKQNGHGSAQLFSYRAAHHSRGK